MKILWKNVWYNLITRWYYWFKYRWAGQHKDSYYPLANWSCWYYPHFKCWTQRQQDQFDAELDYYMHNLRFIPPLLIEPFS